MQTTLPAPRELRAGDTVAVLAKVVVNDGPYKSKLAVEVEPFMAEIGNGLYLVDRSAVVPWPVNLEPSVN